MPAERTPAKLRESHSRSLKTKHRKSDSKLSLKRFVAGLTDDESKIQREDWLFNKRANPSRGPLHIGRTRQRVKSGGNKNQTGKLDGKQKATPR
jgi:hypothetical protein